MPLRAIVRNLNTLEEKAFITSLLSPKRWAELKIAHRSKKVEVFVASSRRKGILKKSKLGLQYIAHKRGEVPVDWKPESEDHMYLKHAVALACLSAGWRVDVEVPGTGYVSDVIALKGETRIAFEIQWSQQTLEKTIERQRLFFNDNLRSVWLFKKLPVNSIGGEVLQYEDLVIPMVQFEQVGSEYLVVLNGKQYQLKSFISDFLNGRRTIKKGKEYSVEVRMKVCCYKSMCSNCRVNYNTPYPEFLNYRWQGVSHPVIMGRREILNLFDINQFSRSDEFVKAIMSIKEPLELQLGNWPSLEKGSWICSKCGSQLSHHIIVNESTLYDFSIVRRFQQGEYHWSYNQQNSSSERRMK